MPGLTLTEGVDRIANAVRDGKCILFLGAGVHSGPPADCKYVYDEAKRPPIGGTLSRHLADRSGFRDDFPKWSDADLQRVAMHFENKLGRKTLVDEITKAVGDNTEPSPVLRGLAALNFRYVITTNYDHLFEEALRRAGKEPRIRIYQKDPGAETTDFEDDASEKHPLLFKIHGDVDDRASMVVTDEDYIHFVMRMSDTQAHHPVPETFRFFFKKNPTLFIGYSLLDYNLRLLFKTLHWRLDAAKRPDMYSVDPYPDKLIHAVYGDRDRIVQFIVDDVWRFVPMLYQAINGTEMPQ